MFWCQDTSQDTSQDTTTRLDHNARMMKADEGRLLAWKEVSENMVERGWRMIVLSLNLHFDSSFIFLDLPLGGTTMRAYLLPPGVAERLLWALWVRHSLS